MTSAVFRRYVIVGVSVYLFELLVIVIAQNCGTQPTVAVGISFWLGVIVSFGLQKIITFGDHRLHHKVLVPQIIAITLLLLFNFGFTIILTNLLAPPLPATIVRTIAIGTTTLWNFYLYRTRIFRTDDIR